MKNRNEEYGSGGASPLRRVVASHGGKITACIVIAVALFAIFL